MARLVIGTIFTNDWDRVDDIVQSVTVQDALSAVPSHVTFGQVKAVDVAPDPAYMAYIAGATDKIRESY